ncbi:unnamed protein product [Ambrosiozyma monospora]|uniref:Unnamed protein product n=1 Tax=Ambrosiozyma monospora TaxID=43982 RepID=A0ACB5U130_AMBMO|nr:unnamed protein product [Ambrosiozyma monospora]
MPTTHQSTPITTIKHEANIYQASAGDYVVGRKVKFTVDEPQRGQGSTHTKIDINDPHRIQLKESSKENYDPIALIDPGHILSPDEVFTARTQVDPTQLPSLSREEVAARCGAELPDPEILNAIHRYFSERLMKSSLAEKLTEEQKERVFTNFMDETALIALGVVIEELVRDLVDSGKYYRNFMEPVEEAVAMALGEQDDEFLLSSEIEDGDIE